MSAENAQKTLDFELLREFIRASADSSSHAFAQFAGVRLRVCETAAVPVHVPLLEGRWPKGIFFDMEGDLEGHIGVLLSPHLCEAVEGVASDRGLSEALDSMLLELGNIVASQTLSAVADGMRGRIVLSIPHLVTEGAERELAWRILHGSAGGSNAGDDPRRVEATFADECGTGCALVVLIPDASSRSV